VRELPNVIEQVAIVSIASVLKLAIEELHLWVESKEEIRTHTQPWPVINCGDGNLQVSLKDGTTEIVQLSRKRPGKIAGLDGATALSGMTGSTPQFSHAEARHQHVAQPRIDRRDAEYYSFSERELAVSPRASNSKIRS
jgi:hypothetical protein